MGIAKHAGVEIFHNSNFIIRHSHFRCPHLGRLPDTTRFAGGVFIAAEHTDADAKIGMNVKHYGNSSKFHGLRGNFPARVHAAREHLPAVFPDLSVDEPIEFFVHSDHQVVMLSAISCDIVHLKWIGMKIKQFDVVEFVELFKGCWPVVLFRREIARKRVAPRKPRREIARSDC